MANDLKPWQAEFLTALRETASVTAAAKAVGYSRSHAYQMRLDDPEFARAWEAALTVLPSLVLDAVVAEALVGAPQFNLVGEVTGHKRNTKLLERLAEKHGVIDPPRPTTAVQINNTQHGELTRSIEEERARLLERMKQHMREAIDVTPSDPDEDLL